TTQRFHQDGSGLDFHNGQLYVVDNKGTFWILDVALDGTLSFVPGFENGKRPNFKSVSSANGPDIEGITVDADGFVYFASERDNSNSSVNWNVILMVDPWAAGTNLTAIKEWDITNALPAVSANLGIEAIEWISNDDVAGKLWDKNTNAPFDPTDYPDAIADGVFFVAMEYNGHVYAFVLYDDETFVMIADIDSKLGGAMALDFDTYEQVLWVVADDGFGNLAAKITFTGEPTVGLIHVNPPSGLDASRNYEGFAIADASYTVNGQRPVYRIEDGPSSRTLAIGSIACDYQVLTYEIVLDPSGARNFGSVVHGYGAQTPHTVTVNSTGTGATGNLNIAISGANASSFTLNKTSITDVAAGGSNTFTVSPVTGLATGTYNATVTVSGDNVVSKTFTVSFTVTAADTTAGIPEDSSDDGGSNTMLYVAVGVAVGLGILGMAWFVFFRP
ncbi:MAG: hypothetical protein FWD37_05600, partial [Methanomassiliicoccaceae archaeon]|nr:hypothetical protein [Methanomassiliicoccaceae archaeon]